MRARAVPGSFRDPAGFVWSRDGFVYRSVSEWHRDDYDHFVGSGLYDRLVEEALLVPHEEVVGAELEPGIYKVLRPEQIEFISYPYEWCFSQLRDAALLTLKAQEICLEYGMSLRDATAYNVQYHKGRPIFIDTLSFGKLHKGRPWIGYRQFCQHFLAPLALMACRDVRLGALLREHIDGVPLDLAAKLLPFSTRLKPSLFIHLHLHARMQVRYARGPRPQRKTRMDFSADSLRRLISSLRRAINGLRWNPRTSPWSDYYDDARHYPPETMERKGALVAEFLDAVQPRTVWDLGANVGAFSRVASTRGALTVSMDVDPACVETNYRRASAEEEALLLPLVVDLASPSPAIGWANRERMSLVDRGPADAVLALALIHHLAIGNNVPFRDLAEFVSKIGRWLVIEFVPKEDPMVQAMLATRPDVFPNYSQQVFEDEFGSRFAIERSEPLPDSPRSLYLMRSK